MRATCIGEDGKPLLMFVCLLALLLLAIPLLAHLYSHFGQPGVVDQSILVPIAKGNLNPKPRERFVFLTCGFVFPVVTIFACLFCFRRRNHSVVALPAFARWALPIAVAALLVFPILRFGFGPALASGHAEPTDHPVRILGWCSVAAAFCYALPSLLGKRLPWRKKERPVVLATWIVLIGSILLQCLSWRLVGTHSLTRAEPWSVSFDAVIYAVSQVVSGKTVLVDLPSQYGLFPELIAPIFQLTSLSLFSFSLMCCVLQLVAMVALVYVLQKLVRTTALQLAGGLALVMVTFETCIWLLGVRELYYQYWPIRFFWPAISTLLCYRYSKKRTLVRSAAVSAASAIGAIWNLDSGAIIVISFAGVLAVKWAIGTFSPFQPNRPNQRHFAVALCLHFAIVLGICATFALYIAAKSNGTVHWSWLYSYQKLFYGLGYGMMPIPLQPSPWMSVIAVYVLGAVISCIGLTKRPDSSSPDLVLFLSLLGLGLFVYYEGRSHILNLISVCWPSILLISILADRSRRMLKAGAISYANWVLPVVGLGCLIYCSIPFVTSIPQLSRDMLRMLVTRNTPDDLLVQDELDFLKAHTHKNQQCAILSLRQGIYYAETATSAPTRGPGYAETILQAESDAMFVQLQQRPPACVFLGLGHTSAIDPAGNSFAFLQGYAVSVTSPLGSMRYYTKENPR